MAIHREMYTKLFRKVSKVIEELEQIQQECEQMYMEAGLNPPVEIAKKAEQKPEKP